jgi:putative endonuclease
MIPVCLKKNRENHVIFSPSCHPGIVSLRTISGIQEHTRNKAMHNKEYTFYVYILTNKRNGTLYVGVTHDLFQRMRYHRSEYVKSFTRKYAVFHLVYYEKFQHIHNAIHKEKLLKKWKREWKIVLIEKNNPTWKDFLGVDSCESL